MCVCVHGCVNKGIGNNTGTIYCTVLFYSTFAILGREKLGNVCVCVCVFGDENKDRGRGGEKR